jgi:hypothetical protein
MSLGSIAKEFNANSKEFVEPLPLKEEKVFQELKQEMNTAMSPISAVSPKVDVAVLIGPSTVNVEWTSTRDSSTIIEKKRRPREKAPETTPDTAKTADVTAAKQDNVETRTKAEKPSDMAMLNEAKMGADIPKSKPAEQAVDPKTLQKEIEHAALKRDELTAELESLNDKLAEMKADTERAKKDLSTISKAKTIDDIKIYVAKKEEDCQSYKGEVFAMEQEGNEKKIAKAKSNLEKAKASLEDAKKLLANFVPDSDNSTLANMKYLELEQNTRKLTDEITAKKNELKALGDAVKIQEKQLASLT